MAGDFAHITKATVAQWPHASKHPNTRGWLPPVSISLVALATFAAGARIWSIRRTSAGFLLDDALLCVALIVNLFFTATCIAGTLHFGFDRHMWDVPPELYDSAALVAWISEIAFLLSTCLTKLSILSFYRRLDPPCPTSIRRIIDLFLAMTVASTASLISAQIFLCHPVSSYWSILERLGPSPQKHVCLSQHVLYPVQGALISFSTFYTVTIPASVIRNVPMAKTQRYGLRAVAILGLVVLGADIARTGFLSRLADSRNGDATWNNFYVLFCGQLECHLSLVCASLPFLQRYLSQYPDISGCFAYPNGKHRNDSVISRVSSSLSGQIKRSLPFRTSNSPRQMEISHPRIVEIPEWEFQTLESARTWRAHSAVDGETYERYRAGLYGPAPPPKDSRDMFDEYRREHGGTV